MAPTPLSPEQHRHIEGLLDSGVTDSEEIARRVGVTRQQVAAVKAWITMRGTIEEAQQIEEEAAGLKFGLEREMERALRENIGALESGLRIVDDGKQRSVEGLRFDITAEDTAGHLVILELKAGTATRDAVGQLLSYIGTQFEQGEKREIRGIIVAHEFDRTAKLAARAAKNISLIRYSYRFKFEPA